MSLLRRTRVVALGGALALVAIAAAAHSQTETEPRAVLAISATGIPVPVDAARARFFERRGFAGLYLLGRRGGSAFYRVIDSADRACYGMGPASVVGRPDSITCLSAPIPLLDWTYVEVTREAPEPRVYRAGGIAADGISTVALVERDGTAVARTVVQNNVYAFSGLSGIRASSLVAFDSGGQALFTRGIGGGGGN